MPDLEHRAVTDWLTELRPVAAAQEWPPAVRPLEMEAGHPEQLVALGRSLDDLGDDHIAELARALRISPFRDDSGSCSPSSARRGCSGSCTGSPSGASPNATLSLRR